jgi:hypothetical protein
VAEVFVCLLACLLVHGVLAARWTFLWPWQRFVVVFVGQGIWTLVGKKCRAGAPAMYPLGVAFPAYLTSCLRIKRRTLRTPGGWTWLVAAAPPLQQVPCRPRRRPPPGRSSWPTGTRRLRRTWRHNLTAPPGMAGLRGRPASRGPQPHTSHLQLGLAARCRHHTSGSASRRSPSSQRRRRHCLLAPALLPPPTLRKRPRLHLSSGLCRGEGKRHRENLRWAPQAIP